MSSVNKPGIIPAPDGPYLLTNLAECTSKNGPVKIEGTAALCRCGASANKPFCDGSHKKIGFSSAKLDGRLEDKNETYKGQKITIHDNRSLCAHAGYCTDNLASVFRMKQEPWIDPNAASVEEIIATIRSCPSGALSYTMDDAEKSRGEGASDPAIHVVPNGPYVVSGGVELADVTWGEGASKNEYTLCRCGASKNKPFCDGTHWDIEFDND